MTIHESLTQEELNDAPTDSSMVRTLHSVVTNHATLRAAIGLLVLQYVASRKTARELGPASTDRYRRALMAFAEIVGTERTIGSVKRRQIEKWFEQRTHAGVADSTLSHEYSILRSFFKWAVETGYIDRSPCEGIKGPRRPESKPRAMERDAVSLTLAACPDARARLIVSLMVQAGLRCCEVASLETSNVSLIDDVMLVKGKGGKERWLPIPEETQRAMTDYFSEQPPVAGPLIRSYQPPFRGVRADRIGAIVSEAMRDAGVKRHRRDGRSAHALRHTFASDLVDGGVDIEDVRAALGHTSLQSTSIYTRRLRATDRLRTAMGGREYAGPGPATDVASRPA